MRVIKIMGITESATQCEINSVTIGGVYEVIDVDENGDEADLHFIDNTGEWNYGCDPIETVYQIKTYNCEEV